MQPNTRRCPLCQSSRFVSVEGAKIELFIHQGASPKTDLQGSAFVCMGCGKMDFFVCDPEQWFQALDKTALRAPRPKLVELDKD